MQITKNEGEDGEHLRGDTHLVVDLQSKYQIITVTMISFFVYFKIIVYKVNWNKKWPWQAAMYPIITMTILK